MSQQTFFWFVHARNPLTKENVGLAVSAFTARSARVQARKTLGMVFVIESVDAVADAHAWVVNFTWKPRPTEAVA